MYVSGRGHSPELARVPTGGLEDLRACLDVLKRKISCPCRNSNPKPSSLKYNTWENTQFLSNTEQYCCLTIADRSETSVCETTRRHIL